MWERPKIHTWALKMQRLWQSLHDFAVGVPGCSIFSALPLPEIFDGCPLLFKTCKNTINAQTAQGGLFQGAECCWALRPWAPWNYTCTIPLGCGTRRAVIDP